MFSIRSFSLTIISASLMAAGYPSFGEIEDKELRDIAAIAGFGVVLDNGVTGDGFVQVEVLDAGETRTMIIDPIGSTGTTDIVYDYFHYAQVNGGPAVHLGQTNVTVPATPLGGDSVVSEGNFAGPNGSVIWHALSLIPEGSQVYTTELRFSSTSPFGDVRIICYLDEDTLGFSDDVLVQLGSPGTSGFQLLTIDDDNDVGVSQSALFTNTWIGWAADEFPELRDAILLGTANFSKPGVVDTSSLPPYFDPRFAGLPTYGPEDITTALAFRLPPDATSAKVVCSVGGKPEATLITQVSLGDSYSSGEGAGAYGDTDREGRNMCHRSENAWTGDQPGGDANAVAIPLAEQRHNVACSGAVVDHLTNAREFPPGGVGADAEPAQLTAESLPDADVVTITIGGNDALFSKVLSECAFTGLFSGATCDDEAFIPGDETESLRDQVENAINSLAGKLATTYQQVQQAARESAVYVLGYPRLFGGNCPSSISLPFQESERNWINELADELNGVIHCAAEQAGVRFVDVRDAFANHHVCAGAQSWLHGVRGTSHDNERFHPNRAGQIGYANTLRDQFGRPAQDSCPALRELAVAAPGAIPEYGELHVEAQVAACGLVFDDFVPGQIVRLIASGFEVSSNVAIRLQANQGAYSESLGAATTDAAGRLDVLVQIPTVAPANESAQLKVTGIASSGANYTLYAPFDLASSQSADTDLDGVPNVCDNCVAVLNSGQADGDGDGLGDACDVCAGDYENDWDQDGLCANADPCPTDPLNDADGDGFCASVDRCPNYPNETGDEAFSCLLGDGFESGDLSAWSGRVP